jgi:hypothetical protein
MFGKKWKQNSVNTDMRQPNTDMRQPNTDMRQPNTDMRQPNTDIYNPTQTRDTRQHNVHLMTKSYITRPTHPPTTGDHGGDLVIDITRMM